MDAVNPVISVVMPPPIPRSMAFLSAWFSRSQAQIFRMLSMVLPSSSASNVKVPRKFSGSDLATATAKFSVFLSVII